MPLDVFDRILRPLRRGPVTSRYPDVPPDLPPAARGLPELDPARCDGSAACVAACPTGAIRRRGADVVARRRRLHLLRRVRPGLPARARSGSGSRIELAVRDRDDLVIVRRTRRADAVTAGRPDRRSPSRRAARPLEPARGRSSATLGRSLHVRHLDAGSCNGCDWEIAALLNPYHDVQRLGIDFVASPRHADLLLVTGIMTRNLEEAARRTYEAMPEPRLVVAVGACAISGGVFAGTYAGRDGIGEVLPVDVFVPGCPPRPEALIHGLLVAVGRMAPFGEAGSGRGR